MKWCNGLIYGCILSLVWRAVCTQSEEDRPEVIQTECDEPELEAAVLYLIQQATPYLIDTEAEETPAHILSGLSLDPTTEEGLQSITCTIAGISSIEDLSAVLGLSLEESTEQYLWYVNWINAVGGLKGLRQVVYIISRFVEWSTLCGFPTYPLQCGPVETWKLLVELKNLPFWDQAIPGTEDITLFQGSSETLTRITHTSHNLTEWTTRLQFPPLQTFILNNDGYFEDCLNTMVAGLGLLDLLVDRGWLAFQETVGSK